MTSLSDNRHFSCDQYDRHRVSFGRGRRSDARSTRCANRMRDMLRKVSIAPRAESRRVLQRLREKEGRRMRELFGIFDLYRPRIRVGDLVRSRSRTAKVATVSATGAAYEERRAVPHYRQVNRSRRLRKTRVHIEFRRCVVH